MTKPKLDEIDLRILGEIQQDSSRPIHELAGLIGISMASCTRRLKRMQESRLILRYVALLNPEELGVDLDVFIKVRLKVQTLKAMQSFHRMVMNMPEVVECYLTTGDSDFLLHVRTAGIREYNRWVQKKLIKEPSIAATYSSIALECIKYSTRLPLAFASAIASGKERAGKQRKKKAGKSSL